VKAPDAAAQGLARVLKRKPQEIKERLASRKPFVWIKRQATPKEAEAVKQLRIPGIEFVSETSRFYPNRALAAHVLGFTGMDGKGLEGVEFFYDSHLRGADTSVKVLRDAHGNGFQSEPPADEDASGKNLVLTLDQSIQFTTETSLAEAVEKNKAKSGMAIVMAPQTGEILALALAPAYNPNAFDEGKKPLWRNRAITDPFEPGSTLKVFSAAAALEFANLSPKTTFHCENGAYRIGKNTVHDVHRYGLLTLQDIIKYSSNIGAVKISERVGPEKLHHTLRLFGFGQRTGIDSPAETAGLLMHHKHWTGIDTAAISFGHGVSVSAVQLITAFSAIANDGVLMRPRVVRAITDQQGQILQQFAPEEVRRVVSRQTAATLRDILQTVVLPGGTGTHAALDGYSACGKTGTARKIDDSGGYSNDRHVASFIGFAPAENAQVAVLVVIDEPKTQIYGGAVAAPVFKKIAQTALNYLNVPPQPAAERLRVAVDGGGRG
jgi:cell division protein FtsI (penicillin-binding protein 3)